MKLVSTLLLTLTIVFAIGCKTDEAGKTDEAAPGAIGAACTSCTGGRGKECKSGAGADCQQQCKDAGACTGACKEGEKPGGGGGACKEGEKADPNMGALGDKYNLPSCGGESKCSSKDAACPSAGKTCPTSGQPCGK